MVLKQAFLLLFLLAFVTAQPDFFRRFFENRGDSREWDHGYNENDQGQDNNDQGQDNNDQGQDNNDQGQDNNDQGQDNNDQGQDRYENRLSKRDASFGNDDQTNSGMANGMPTKMSNLVPSIDIPNNTPPGAPNGLPTGNPNVISGGVFADAPDNTPTGYPSTA